MVNTWGDLLMDRLQHIPNCARDIATHGVRQGAAAAVAMAQTCNGHKLHLLEPVFPEGEDWAGFDELVMQFHVAADAIGNDVSTDSVVKRVFLSED